MTSRDRSNLTVETLFALRSESDAVRIITERLRVKEMGPADHIRTKHEVKMFVESGERKIAENLLMRAQERRQQNERITETVSAKRNQEIVP